MLNNMAEEMEYREEAKKMEKDLEKTGRKVEVLDGKKHLVRAVYLYDGFEVVKYDGDIHPIEEVRNGTYRLGFGFGFRRVMNGMKIRA